VRLTFTTLSPDELQDDATTSTPIWPLSPLGLGRVNTVKSSLLYRWRDSLIVD